MADLYSPAMSTVRAAFDKLARRFLEDAHRSHAAASDAKHCYKEARDAQVSFRETVQRAQDRYQRCVERPRLRASQAVTAFEAETSALRSDGAPGEWATFAQEQRPSLGRSPLTGAFTDDLYSHDIFIGER
jgi:phage shock protein A